MINIVLYEPEQPGNAGNIGRSCVCTGSSLHFIEPLGFFITDRHIKRAGLDYWPRLDVHRYFDYPAFLKECGFPDLREASFHVPGKPEEEKGMAGKALPGSENGPSLWYVTTKAKQCYTDVRFHDGDYLMFGPESRGIPEDILAADPEHCIRIPMAQEERSLNLANSVSIVLYEALRQLDFPGLEREGELHGTNGSL